MPGKKFFFIDLELRIHQRNFFIVSAEIFLEICISTKEQTRIMIHGIKDSLVGKLKVLLLFLWLYACLCNPPILLSQIKIEQRMMKLWCVGNCSLSTKNVPFDLLCMRIRDFNPGIPKTGIPGSGPIFQNRNPGIRKASIPGLRYWKILKISHQSWQF